MRIAKNRVAFFDSGIGGLTVLNACCKKINEAQFYYYGDNKRAPYGNLTLTEIQSRTLEIFEQFSELSIKAAVVACNTVTATCIEILRERYPFSVIGAEPAIFSAIKKGRRVLVLATKATCKSDRFQALCQRAKKEYPSAEILVSACPFLAEAIEQNIGQKDFDFTKFLPREKADVVVLGCTHYIYIEEKIRQFYGCEVVDGNEGIARRLETVLACEKENNFTWNCNNRESQPQTEKVRDEKPFLTTFQSDGPKLEFERQKIQKNEGFCEFENIRFLGENKGINAKIYKQMFAFGVDE